MRPISGHTAGFGIVSGARRSGLKWAVAAFVLAPLPAYAQPIANISILSTAVAAGAVALAFAAALWAVAEQGAASRLRRALKAASARARAAVGERDALIGAGSQALIVWGRDGTGPFSYRGKSMKEAHRGMGITNAEFDALAADLKMALERNGVGAADIEQVMRVVGATRADIVEGSPAPEKKPGNKTP